jgi:hypothetical protein
MAPLEKRVIESGLARKGFKKDNADHRYYRFFYQGKETSIRTKVSHSPKVKDIDDNLLSLIKRQLHLDSNKQLIELCKCPLTERDYIDILLGKNRLQSI